MNPQIMIKVIGGKVWISQRMTECVNVEVRIFYSQMYATYENKEKGRKTKKLCHTNKMKINLKLHSFIDRYRQTDRKCI